MFRNASLWRKFVVVFSIGATGTLAALFNYDLISASALRWGVLAAFILAFASFPEGIIASIAALVFGANQGHSNDGYDSFDGGDD